jgi:hypothetical protein
MCQADDPIIIQENVIGGSAGIISKEVSRDERIKALCVSTKNIVATMPKRRN